MNWRRTKAGWPGVSDEDALLIHDGTVWNEFSGSGGETTAAQLADGSVVLAGINTTADATNRLAVKSDAVLFSHDDVAPGNSNSQAKVNKAGAANTASFLFQTN